MNIETVVEKVMDKYRTCKSYKDAGHTDVQTESGETIHFTTHFVAPDKFKFQWNLKDSENNQNGINAVWSNGVATYEMYDFLENQVQKSNDLLSAVAAATGVSKGIIRTIYRLVFQPPKHSNFGLKEVLDLIEDDLLGERCWVISGSALQPKDTSIWIDSADWHIRKVRSSIILGQPESAQRSSKFNDINPDRYSLPERLHVQDCIYSKVTFNEEIPARMFEL